MMVQYGRDERRVGQMVCTALRYLALCAGPALVGLAVISGPVIRVLYGVQYLPTIQVLALASVMAIPKALLRPPQDLLATAEKQGFLVRWCLVCAILNVALDVALIPRYAAIGAALANGGAQAVTALGLWVKARNLFRLKIPFGALAKIGIACAAMAVASGSLTLLLNNPWLSLVCAPPLGAIVFLAVLQRINGFEGSDRERMLHVRDLVPRPLRTLFDRTLDVLIPVPAAGNS